MRMSMPSQLVEVRGNQVPIIKSKNYGFLTHILEKVHEQLEAMLSHYSRVCVIRFDLHTSAYTDNNLLVSQFMRKLIKRLKLRYGLVRVGYAWARELESAESQHYHVALMLDGSVIRGQWGVMGLVNEIWTGWGQPAPFACENGVYQASRSDPESLLAPFYRMSYLAKDKGKGQGKRGKFANDYSTSRIKPRPAVLSGRAEPDETRLNRDKSC